MKLFVLRCFTINHKIRADMSLIRLDSYETRA